MTAARRTWTRWTAAGLALALAGSAGATVVMALGFDEMAAQADRVVLGEVRYVTPAWVVRDGEQTIETTIDIAVEEELGNVSAEPVARIVQPGGQIGDRGLYVSGMPEFRPGERVLVFLRASGVDGQGRTVHSVVGMAQGKFVVLPRLGGGFDAVQQFGSGFALAEADADGTIRVAEGKRPMRLDLDEALARVRAARGEVAP